MSISSRTRSKLKQREESISLLLNLPEEVHDEIFFKLPAESILSARCVCKLFCNLLSKPNFIRNHVNRTKINNPKLLCFEYFKAHPPVIYSVPIDYASISSSSVASSYSFDSNNFINYASISSSSHQFLGSCHGIICFKISPFGMCRLIIDCYYRILNPLTGEFKETTDPFHRKLHTHIYNVAYGFGFDSNINDYKLVVISDFEEAGCFKIDVYAVKSDSWSRVQGSVKYSFVGGKGSRGVFLNGMLHWLGKITTQETSSEVIVSCDVINETMEDMLLPGNIMPPVDCLEEAYKIVELWGDCICVAYIWDSVRIDVWVMQEYGVKQSWIKRFTSTERQWTKYLYWKPLWCYGSGEILVDNKRHLLLYDPRTKRVSTVSVSDISMDDNRESYVESRVSLNSGTYLEKRTMDGRVKDLELPTQVKRYCRRRL